jgi:hypothetical protein
MKKDMSISQGSPSKVKPLSWLDVTALSYKLWEERKEEKTKMDK